MKNVSLLLVAVVMISCVMACKDEASNMPQIEAMQDSIFQKYPSTVAAVRIHLEHETDIKIVLGGQALFKQSAEQHKTMANDIGMMAIRLFGKNNYLKTGELVITGDERNKSDSPADGIICGINVDSLKKVSGN